MIDSTNPQAPDFGPEWPIYPELPQVVRVAEAGFMDADTGKVVYSGFICQYAAPLVLRDREACYIHEPNSLPLSPAYYDARLVTSYRGLPLLATTCCPVPGGSSSSASSS